MENPQRDLVFFLISHPQKLPIHLLAQSCKTSILHKKRSCHHPSKEEYPPPHSPLPKRSSELRFPSPLSICDEQASTSERSYKSLALPDTVRCQVVQKLAVTKNMDSRGGCSRRHSLWTAIQSLWKDKKEGKHIRRREKATERSSSWRLCSLQVLQKSLQMQPAHSLPCL